MRGWNQSQLSGSPASATTNLTVWFFPQHPTEQGGWGGTLTFSSLFKASIHQKTGLFPFILTIHQFM